MSPKIPNLLKMTFFLLFTPIHCMLNIFFNITFDLVLMKSPKSLYLIGQQQASKKNFFLCFWWKLEGVGHIVYRYSGSWNDKTANLPADTHNITSLPNTLRQNFSNISQATFSPSSKIQRHPVPGPLNTVLDKNGFNF